MKHTLALMLRAKTVFREVLGASTLVVPGSSLVSGRSSLVGSGDALDVLYLRLKYLVKNC